MGRTGLFLGLGLALLTLAGCAPFPDKPESSDARPATPPAEDEGTGEAIVAAARATLGTPYEYGGEDPSGFDCSGLVQYTHERSGMRVPRTVERQQAAARPVDPDALQPGDLVFFRLDGWKASHVGIYVGDGRFIHAPSSDGQVRYDHLQERYWARHFDSAGRLHTASCCDNTASR